MNRSFVGVILMFVALALYPLSDALIKHLLETYTVSQTAFLRAFSRLIPLVLVAGFNGSLKNLFTTKLPKQHVIRLSVNILYTYCFILAFSMSQLTTVYTLSYTSSIFMILLSAMVLKEKLSWEKWFAVCFGLIGIIIAIQPGSTIFEWGALLILFGTFLGALNKILMRKLSQTEPVWAITIYPNLLMVIVTLPFLFYSWQPMPWEHWALFGGVGLIASLGQYLIAEALRYTQGSILAPIDYSTFFWVMAIDHFLWQKGVASHYLIGAAIIIVSNLFIVYYSRKTASQSLNSVK